MRQEKFLEVFDNLPTKRKQVLLGILKGDTREKIMADFGVSEAALTQHRRQLFKDFQIEVFQNEADDSRSGERKLPQLIALCAKYKPELISPNAALVSPSRPEFFLFPNFLIYEPQTWVGRKLMVEELLAKLQGQTRLLWITGISGIGKTTLGECLASQAWESNPSFQWIYLEVLEGQGSDFTAIAAGLLTKLGEKELDPQERNDPKCLIERLLHKLQTNRYWIQLDALERLLNPEQPTEFSDAYWLTFFQRCLTELTFASRLVLTAQALPEKMVRWKYQHENTWCQVTLGGLSVKDQEPLEFFNRHGVPVNEISRSILSNIGQIYEGHPLALRVIAGEIYDYFKGDVISYWDTNRREFEQTERTLSQRLNETERNEELDRQVRDLVKQSLNQLPLDALNLLCRSAVYRRAVPKKFWLALISNCNSAQQEGAYRVLGDRALIEREGVHQGQFLIRQHNLIRDVSYYLLKQDTPKWEVAERKAADLWLTAYQPALNTANLEIVRGYLEAFNHYLNVQDHQEATKITYKELETGEQLHWQVFVWGYYKEFISMHENILKIASEISSNRGQSDALGNLGIVYDTLGEHEKAISYHHQALSIAHKTDDHRGKINALNNLGIAYEQLGQYKQAVKYYKQSQMIAHKNRDYEGEVDAIGNLGVAYDHLGKYEQAIKYYEQVQMFACKNRKYLRKAVAIGNIGTTLIKLNKYSEALERLQQAIELLTKLEAPYEKAKFLKNLAKLYQKLGQYNLALKYCEQALILSVELGIPLAEECKQLKEDLERHGSDKGE